MGLPNDWWRLDATGQAALIRDGVATPSELVEAAIARIEVLNPAINAVITPLYDEARQIATDLPEANQPFRGVPILLKDAGEELDGTPYYLGTALLRDIGHRSTRTTEFVRRLLAAGFVPIGKTNVPPLSSGFSTEPAAFGPTRNPWDLERAAGGSSGGSAAAVAAGMVSVAHGSDANGSIRVPAACCGLVTLRPSRGAVPVAVPLELPNVGELWKSFVLARSVRDLETTFEAVAEPSVVSGASAAQLRIGTMLDDPDWSGSVHLDVIAGVRRASELLTARGHSVEVSHPAALDGLFGSLGDLPQPVSSMQTELSYRWLEERVGRSLEHSDVDAPLLGPRPDVMPSQQAVETAVRIVTARFEEALPWWDDFDVMLMPAMRQPAWPLGNSDWDAVGILPMEFTHIGFPSLVLPIGMTGDGLPLAVQLTGRRGADGQLLELAAQLEADAPWADRWPSLATGGG